MFKHEILCNTINNPCSTSNRTGQSADDSVRTVIKRMFTAMGLADTSMLRSCFSPGMILETISRDKEGKTIVLREDPNDFIDFLGREKAGAADERIEFELVKVDGPLASVWTPYSFYYNGIFSHCGVNSFQLVKINGEWKIRYLIDTRRKQGCK